MLDWSWCSAVERVPGKVSGAGLFRGTRVPVTALFENLEDGATVGQFLEWVPGVRPDLKLTFPATPGAQEKGRADAKASPAKKGERRAAEATPG